jgi:hypothetical protein
MDRGERPACDDNQGGRARGRCDPPVPEKGAAVAPHTPHERHSAVSSIDRQIDGAGPLMRMARRIAQTGITSLKFRMRASDSRATNTYQNGRLASTVPKDWCPLDIG